MQPTYFASFLLGETPAQTPPISACIEEIANWIFNNRHRSLSRPSDWPNGATEALNFESGESIQILQFPQSEHASVRTAAIRFEHSDDEKRHWRTDCIVTKLSNGGDALRFAVTVSAGSTGESLYPVSPPRTRPRIVKAIIDKFGARERYPLKSTFVRIKSSDVEQFVQFLLSPERTIPLVFVSRRNRSEELLCDPNELADKLAGIAYVCVAESSQVSKSLTDHIDNRLNAYDGTIRIYWPRMTLNDPPFKHRWWTGQQIAFLKNWGRLLSSEVLPLVASASITRHVSGLTHWEDVEREIAKHTLQKLQEAGSDTRVTDEWFRQYETDLAAFDAEKREKSQLADRLREREEELRQWKQMYLQQLRSSTTRTKDTEADTFLIEDVEAAIHAASNDFREELAFIDGRVDKTAAEFEEPELLYTAFSWLATVYYNAKVGKKRCADFDKSCREICQFRYSGHQSEITMGMFASDYEVIYGKKTFKLKEHIGFGTSTEPRHTIRVAFFFDSESKKVVVGYIGQHQATRKSN